MSKHIDFYFDFISPYSYLAHKKIINLNQRNIFNYKAILLGGLHNLGKVIAPAALFYFRWAAAFTILSGLILAALSGYLHDAMTLSIGSGVPKHTAIGIGMWLGIIMAFNVWFVIWPNQKRALGIIECEPELKAKSAKTAMLFSRTNTLLSMPMLLSMVAAQNLY